jgi:hypothetical protein
VSACVGDKLGRWQDRAAGGGPAGGWLLGAMGNSLRATADRRVDGGTRPPSNGFGRGVLQPVMGGSSSFNR